ncbi:hypothetical protein HK102_001610 [Quaeritorhiza haematococci]|nr:hypothetical protein HK102_001610 [Quaeritorhiza haematococci]
MKSFVPAVVSALVLTAGSAMAQTANIAQLQQLMNDAQFNGLVQPCNDIAAAWLRAAFHDAGVFRGGVGGADGSLQFEASAPENRGLEGTISFFRQTKARFPEVSYADIVNWGGIISVKSCGGPDIPFEGGRIDATGPQDVSVIPGNPESPISSLKQGFQGLGLSVQDFVALSSGGHTLGGRRSRGAFEPFDQTPTTFDNQIFKDILANQTVLPSDSGLAADAETRTIVERFANDQNAFFTAFQQAYIKMMRIGPNATPQNLVVVDLPRK